MELVVFLLISYGISNIMVFSTIFERWRNFTNKYSPNFFGELFSCMICLPFWIGVFLSFFVYSPSLGILNLRVLPLNLLLDACIASGGVWIIHTFQEYLENKNG